MFMILQNRQKRNSFLRDSAIWELQTPIKKVNRRFWGKNIEKKVDKLTKKAKNIFKTMEILKKPCYNIGCYEKHYMKLNNFLEVHNGKEVLLPLYRGQR